MRNSWVLGFSLVALSAVDAAAQPYSPRPPRPPGPTAMLSGGGLLRNRAQGMCLDVDGWNARGNGNVLLWECNGDPDQVWSFSPGGELVDAVGGVCLDAAGYDGRQGANVDVYRCERLADQRWMLAPRDGGSFELRNEKSGLCLDVQGRNGAHGDNVLLWACDGGADQRWSWEPYGGPSPERVQMPPRRPPYRDPPVDHNPMVDPPPPPPPVMQPIAGDELRALRQAIEEQGMSSDKLTVLKQAARTHLFRVGQVKELLGLLAFSADKLHGLELLAPRLVDGENSFALYDAFSFSSDKDKAREILRRSGY